MPTIPTQKLLLIFAFLISSIIVRGVQESHAQNDPQKKVRRKYRKILNKGEALVRVEEYAYALEFLQKYDSLIPNDKACEYLLGLAYFHTEVYQKAKYYLAKSFVSEERNVEHQYYLGRTYHLHHAFDSALHHYQHTLNLEIAPEREKDLQRLMAQCKVGMELIKRPKNVEKFNLGPAINSPFPDFAPVLSADETQLFFTSRRPNKYHQGVDPDDNMPFEDIYMTESQEDGTWGKPVNLQSINTEGHDASIGLSPDGNMLFIYRGEKAVSGYASGNIYHTSFKNGAWSEPISMQKGVNSKAQETHATILADETLLFISSTRINKQSFGGKDIYVVRRLPDLTWAEPENLGEIINTPFDEDSPYITADGKTLYFSSNGPKSMGGYDIFYTHFNARTKQWTEPKNMGYPVNTAADDIFIVWSADGTRGYFSSKKEDASGEQDLYMIMLPEEERKLVAIKGKIVDDATGKPIAATIEILDNETHELVQVVNSNNYNGKFSAHLPPDRNYGIRVTKKGYLFESLNIYVPHQFEYLEIKHDFRIKRMAHNQVAKLNNIFFNEGAELLEDSYPEMLALKKLIQDNPEFQIEIAVHSDNSQDSLVNLMLTKAQAEAITYQLERLGASDKRVTAKGYGYGELFPVSSNGTRLGRAKNNRIEYVVRSADDKSQLDYGKLYANMEISLDEEADCYDIQQLTQNVLKQQDITFDTKANVLDQEAEETIKEIVRLMDECPDIKLEVSGYGGEKGSEQFKEALSLQLSGLVAQKIVFYGIDSDRVSISDPKKDKDGNDQNTLRVSFRAQEATEKPEIIIADGENYIPRKGDYLAETVFFDHDSYTVKDEQKESIEKVVALLEKHPKLTLQVEGHSDATGAAAYNMQLSKKRTNNIVEHLKKLGVSPERLSFKAYGEGRAEAASPVGSAKVHNRKCIFLVTQSAE